MIKNLITKLAEKGEQSYSLPGKVVEIDDKERTCTIQPHNDDAEILGVRLQANIGLDLGWVIIPKIGSDVIVTFLNDETGYVAIATDVEKVTLNVENQSLFLDKKGMQLGSDKSDLKTELNNLTTVISGLCDTLVKFQLSTNVGATISVMPHIITELTEAKAKVGKIESQMNTFLQ